MSRLYKPGPIRLISTSILYALITAVLLLILISAQRRLVVLTFIQFIVLALTCPYFMLRALDGPREGQEEGEKGRRGEGAKSLSPHPPITPSPNPHFRWLPKKTLSGLLGSLRLVGASLLAGAVVTIAGGTLEFDILLGAHLALVTYAVMVAGMFLLVRLIVGGQAGHVIVTVMLFAFMANLFFMNGLIDNSGDGFRGHLIAGMLTMNPLTAIGEGLFKIDVIRMTGPVSIYDLSHVSYHLPAYPGYLLTLIVYMGIGIVTGAAGILLPGLKVRSKGKSHEEQITIS